METAHMSDAAWEMAPARPRIDFATAALFLTSGALGIAGVVGVISGAGGVSPQLYQGVGFAFAAMVMTFVNAQWVMSWARVNVGRFMLIHVAFAALSGVLASSPVESVIRYVLLLPAMSMMLAAVEMGEEYANAMRGGFTMAALAVLSYSVYALDWNQLSVAEYRGGDYLNPNTIGYYAAICSLSLGEYAIATMKRRNLSVPNIIASLGIPLAVLVVPGLRLKDRVLVLFYTFGYGICVLCILAAKSRTAAVSLLAGAAAILILKFGVRVFLILAALLVLIIATLASGTAIAAMQWVSDVFQFEDRYRGLSTGSGRFEGWVVAIRYVWLPNWLLGVGPGLQAEAGQGYQETAGAHNGLLVDLCETGLLGTVPVLGMFAICVKNGIRTLRLDRRHFAIATLFAALVESIGEPTLLSIGNPGGFLVLLSLAMLAFPPQPIAEVPSESNTDDGALGGTLL
jgi:hypothetical protein